MSTYTPEKLSASIGERGASIHYNNVYSHPLTFHLEYPEDFASKENAELNARGKALARLLAQAPALLTQLEKSNRCLTGFRDALEELRTDADGAYDNTPEGAKDQAAVEEIDRLIADNNAVLEAASGKP